jgi:hypothetical protein
MMVLPTLYRHVRSAAFAGLMVMCTVARISIGLNSAHRITANGARLIFSHASGMVNAIAWGRAGDHSGGEYNVTRRPLGTRSGEERLAL